MKASFRKEYLLGILHAAVWVAVGAASVLLTLRLTAPYRQLLPAVADIVLIVVGEWVVCMLSDRSKEQIKPAKHIETVPNPLDQVPISAQKKEMPAMARVHYAALIGEQGNELLQWSLEGKTAIIIGKGTATAPVDIDLSGSAMAQMISKQHAVLNYTDRGWYVDDIDSKNGTRVKKKNQSALLDVKLVGAVEVEAGDIIYIANAMLQLK